MATKAKTASRKPLEFPAGIRTVPASQVKKDEGRLRSASISRSLLSLKKAVEALSNGNFREAVRRAITSAIDAAASYRQNPEVAVRIIRGARLIAKKAVMHNKMLQSAGSPIKTMEERVTKLSKKIQERLSAIPWATAV